MLRIPTLFGRATAVLDQHAYLEALVARLKEVRDGLAHHEPAPVEARAELLKRFVAEMAAHFAAEEDEGYFGTLVELRPELANEVAALCSEHKSFLVAARWLLENVAAAESDAYVKTLSLLLDRFSGHEVAENRLLQHFFEELPTERGPDDIR